MDEGQDEEPLEEGQHQVDKDSQYVGTPRPAPAPFPGAESQPKHAQTSKKLLQQEDTKHHISFVFRAGSSIEYKEGH